MTSTTEANGGDCTGNVGEHCEDVGEDIVDAGEFLEAVGEICIRLGGGGEELDLLLLFVTRVNPERAGLGENRGASPPPPLLESFTERSFSTGLEALFTPVFKSALLFSLLTTIILGLALDLRSAQLEASDSRLAGGSGNNLVTIRTDGWCSEAAIAVDDHFEDTHL